MKFLMVVLGVFMLPFSGIFDRNAPATHQPVTGRVDTGDFEVVGYLFISERKGAIDLDKIAYRYLTTINYAFVLPAADFSGDLIPVRRPDVLKSLVKKAHSNKVKVLASVGGFDIGDGPGIDTRFERLANTQTSRTNFAHACMNLVREFDLDGIDIDWEFPDPQEPSLSDFVFLMKELSDSLKPVQKKLTAAIESHRLPYTYGIDEASFQYVDWFNIMVYDGEEIGWHRPHPTTSHSPYWLAVESLDYWLGKRGLPKEKAVVGVPFYGKGQPDQKRGYGGYRNLLARGADPYSDTFDSIYYNGIKTMKRKTKLALDRGRGIMIWEITSDTTGKYSLLKAIHDAINEKD